MEEYNFSAKLRDKEVKFRKWKVKDKKKFTNNLKDPIAVKEALVYDCLEDKNIALSEEEYKYLLFMIREQSLSSKVSFMFTCQNCKTEYQYDANLNEVMTPSFQPLGEIEVGNNIFNMGRIQSRPFYEQIMTSGLSESEKRYTDFILHIHAVNDQDGFSFEDYVDFINELDIQDFETVFEKWEEMKFKVDNVHEVKCPNCSSKELFEFDALPGFFPDSWEQ